MPEDRQERLSEKIARLVSPEAWPGVLAQLGILDPMNTDAARRYKRGVPCPACGGTDRFSYFRSTRKDAWVHSCRHCGSGDSMALAVKVLGDYKTAAMAVLNAVGESPAAAGPAPVAPAQVGLSPEERERRQASMKRLWNACQPVSIGDGPAGVYLATRVPGLQSGLTFPSLRWTPTLDYWADVNDKPTKIGHWPALVAAIQGADGKVVNLHRTWLQPDGSGKALIAHPETGEVLKTKKIMPPFSDSQGAIRLGAPTDGKLAIAEGIETALAGFVYEGRPTWATVHTHGMRHFQVPSEVSDLLIFADHDRLGTGKNPARPGFSAAIALKSRSDVQLRCMNRTLRVEIRTPGEEGQDMADFLIGLHAGRSKSSSL